MLKHFFFLIAIQFFVHSTLHSKDRFHLRYTEYDSTLLVFDYNNKHYPRHSEDSFFLNLEKSNLIVKRIDFGFIESNFSNIDSFLMNNFKYLKNVKGIYFSRFVFSSFPMSVLRYSNLEDLSFYGDGVGGGLTHLPAEIGNLKKLSYLGIIDNQLSDSSFNLLLLTVNENLRLLALDNNNLTTIPPSINRLKALEGLFLSGNCINTVSANIYELSKLKFLLVASTNRLSRRFDCADSTLVPITQEEFKCRNQVIKVW